jgi:hypothetical protein
MSKNNAGDNTQQRRVFLANPLKRRIPYRENTVEGILLYGKDNLYPQRMGELLKRSGTTESSVELFAKFVRGAGFKDATLNTVAINAAGQTAADICKQVIQDYRIFRSFAIHVDYNAFLQPVNPKVVQFDYCRLGVPDRLGNVVKIVKCDDWAYEKGRVPQLERVDRFNPDPTVVLEQVKRAGGLHNYKGQILYANEFPNQYSAAVFDSILPDVETDAQISVYRETSVNTKFLADYMLEYPGTFANETEKALFERTLANLQGVANNGKVMLVENPFTETKPLKLHKLEPPNTDKLFEWTDNSARTKIRQRFTQPAILVGDLVPGRLGNTQEIENTVNFYNMFTHDDRTFVSRMLMEVLRVVPGVTATTFDIQPLTWQMFMQTLGVPTAAGTSPTAGANGSTGVKLGIAEFNKVKKMADKFKAGTVTEAEAILFIKGYGITEEEAKTLLYDAANGDIDGV